MKLILTFFFSVTLIAVCKAQQSGNDCNIFVGASRFKEYIPTLKNKNVVVVANATSVIGGVHLIDTLIKLNVRIKYVFAPEHGFRGDAEAGETVVNGVDKITGVKVISLYGDHKKPRKEDLENVQYVIYDIQDVGARFYTYISTLQYVMEACAENKIPLIILDRPNPHGYYIDGPILDIKYKSFVGMQPIPVVHGMTIAEYASMLNGEGLLLNKEKCKLKVVRMKGWSHQYRYVLPVNPSPNLPTKESIELYPSLCFFEGTNVSVGRGTEKPFEVIGYPENPDGDYKFTPKSITGKSKNPPFENQLCKGYDLKSRVSLVEGKINLSWLLDTYKSYPDKSKFFTKFFDTLAGSTQLREQIESGMNENEIRKSWSKDLEKFKVIRKKYLLYAE